MASQNGPGIARESESEVSGALIGRLIRRLMPFLLLMYLLSFLDRANVGFARAAFQADTGIGDAAYAFGAGLFFLGYALLEVPSNLILARVGARVWLCRIMVSWGLVSAAMVLAHDALTFYLLRFALGVAEAGFFPGVIFYLTLWFPAAARGRVMGLFYFGAPLALMLGGPLSGALLELDGLATLHGWQWMFLVEGLMATVVGIWAFFYLDDRPEQARWLSRADREQLSRAMAAEASDRQQHGSGSVLKTLGDPRLLLLCLIYALIQASVYGVVFYLPGQVAALMGAQVGLAVGLVSALPWLCALLAAWAIPRFSDRRGERRLTATVTLAAAGGGIAASAWLPVPSAAVLALCVAAAGFIAVQPLFWTFPTAWLQGRAAAGGIALINSVGALGGFAAPNLKQGFDTLFGNDQAGLYALAVLTLLGALLLLSLGRLGLSGGGTDPRATGATDRSPAPVRS